MCAGVGLSVFCRKLYVCVLGGGGGGKKRVLEMLIVLQKWGGGKGLIVCSLWSWGSG